MDELQGKTIPHSDRAEQAVIGAMLIRPSCIPDVLEKLKAEEFYRKTNRDIFETIYSMFAYGQTIDPVPLIDQMKVRGVFTDTTEEYLTETVSLTPTAANVMEYASIVRDRALLRSLGEVADSITELVNGGSGEADSMLETAERMIYGLRNGREIGRLLPVSTVVQNVFDELNAAAEAGNRVPGIPTGFTFHFLLVHTKPP